MKAFKDKEILKMPEEEWIVVDGMHEPLIDLKTWDTESARTTRNVIFVFFDLGASVPTLGITIMLL